MPDTTSTTSPCDGPLVWFDLDDDPASRAAVLECNRCDYIIATGSFHDEAHAHTPLIRA